jgi:hypothetical protein
VYGSKDPGRGPMLKQISQSLRNGVGVGESVFDGTGFRARGKRHVVYRATETNENPAPVLFKLVGFQEEGAVFENLHHDFQTGFPTDGKVQTE